jgi:putative DNA base modification enzyme with NMAD domain
MRVTQKITFNEYWKNPIYFDKKPVRNGSRKMMAGDNIYYLDTMQNTWCQADSYHSNPDGSTDLLHLSKDTSSDKVLISRHFAGYVILEFFKMPHPISGMGQLGLEISGHSPD